MARTVDEIMNRELFSVAPGERCDRAAAYILAMGIGSAPVLGDDRRPVGVVSLRDLYGAPPASTVAERMTAPAIAIPAGTPTRAAAERFAERGIHHAPVVDGLGRAVGFVSAVDLLRALVGAPVSHPAVFPHLDAAAGVTWSDDAPLDLEHLERAPAAAGVLVLVHGGANIAEQVVWADDAPNLRLRLLDLIGGARRAAPELARWLGHGHLRFRYAVVRDGRRRMAAAERMKEEARRASLAGTRGRQA